MKHQIQSITLAFALALPTAAIMAEENPDTSGVNINEANTEKLATALDGIGPVKAQAIVEFRETDGEFVTPEHLEEVKGIGTATIESNRSRIRID